MKTDVIYNKSILKKTFLKIPCKMKSQRRENESKNTNLVRR